MDIRRQVGLNLKRLREAKKLSQETFALDTGVHRTYVSGVERGIRNPTVTIVAKLAAGLGVSPDELLRPAEIKQGLRGRKG
jgi:transcriptional regulator with XRE-family HTH domain